eukprot:COSAG05_NODE_87_length_20404_cov_42.272051_8_plen_206_part_00
MRWLEKRGAVLATTLESNLLLCGATAPSFALQRCIAGDLDEISDLAYCRAGILDDEDDEEGDEDDDVASDDDDEEAEAKRTRAEERRRKRTAPNCLVVATNSPAVRVIDLASDAELEAAESSLADDASDDEGNGDEKAISADAAEEKRRKKDARRKKQLGTGSGGSGCRFLSGHEGIVIGVAVVSPPAPFHSQPLLVCIPCVELS